MEEQTADEQDSYTGREVMAESLNGAVFTCQEQTAGVAVTCEVKAVNTSPRVNCEAVRDRLVSLAEQVVTGRPLHVLELVSSEGTTATLMLADEEEIRAADVRGWMAEACNVPVEQVTITKFLGTHAVFAVPVDELEDHEGRVNGWWRDAGDRSGRCVPSGRQAERRVRRTGQPPLQVTGVPFRHRLLGPRTSA